MTNTVATVQRTGRAGVRPFAQVLWEAIGARSDRSAARSGYHEQSAIGGQDLDPEKRLELALRWHARHGRAL